MNNSEAAFLDAERNLRSTGGDIEQMGAKRWHAEVGDCVNKQPTQRLHKKTI